MRIHFISIGGSIMHQLAIALHLRGDHVSGSDDAIYEPAHSALAEYGLLPQDIGYDAHRITNDIDLVILGMHTKKDNPELARVQALGLRMLSFPEFIYEHAQHKKRIVVAGSHGKTSTTAMIMHVLKKAGISFDYLVGARLREFPYSVSLSDAPYFIAEGDEYLASALNPVPKFLFYKAHLAIITGIAWDHINVFATFESYLTAFSDFIRSIESGGILIYNMLDPHLARLVTYRNDLQLLPYTLPAYHIDTKTSRVILDGTPPSTLSIFGEHNLLNLSAARAACAQLGVSSIDFNRYIADFTGATKRMECVYDKGGLLVYRDFAHAPSKVAASIHAVREHFKNRPVQLFLELHTYSSLREDFLPHYTEVLRDAGEITLFYNPEAAAKKNTSNAPTLTPARLRTLLGALPNVYLSTDVHELETRFRVATQIAHSVILLMSSGNFGGADLSVVES